MCHLLRRAFFHSQCRSTASVACDNVGDTAMITLIAYSPIGPEQILRELPNCEIVPRKGQPAAVAL